jgi:energy-coupling factor transport system ATP-binding protein
MALRTAGLEYVYSRGTAWAQPALTQVDVSIERGEVVLIAGSTGSGKSTLLRLLAGLLEPTAGAIELDGAPLTTSAARGVVGLLFQDAEAQLFAETVLDDVAFGPRNLGFAESEVAASANQALIEAGLDPEQFGGRSPFALSGGEARRAALAGILAMRPSYLLLDEPTAALDASGREAVLSAVKRLRERAGVLVVSHDLEEFLGIADRVLVLHEGAVSFWGATDELLASPEAFARAGLTVPPVLQTMHEAAARGLAVIPTLDPHVAAESLLAAWGRDA